MAEGERRTVAVVDDDSAVGQSFRFLLEISGHPVDTFTSAADFLAAKMQQLRCLILDQHMPQMTGLELAETLRSDGSSIPILLITGSPSPAVVAKAARPGVLVLEKPPDEKDLLEFINGAPT